MGTGPIAGRAAAAGPSTRADSSGANAGGEGHFLENVRQLVYQGGRSGEGYFSPDGK
jgi:hypothetical protein